MKYIDIHGHVNFPDYGNDREEVISRTLKSDVGMITVGTDKESSQSAVELARKHDNMWATVGIHPMDAHEKADLSAITELAKDPKVVAIGECGLDYFHSKPEDIEQQKKIFIDHILLANKVGKPLMLHIRNRGYGGPAYHEAVELLKKHAKVRANFHFFAGTIEDLKEILAINGTVSFTGVITFTHDYDEVIKQVPLESIMSETDCPFVSPDPYRGKRNEPSYVLETIKTIAKIRGEDEEKVAKQLLENARGMFGLG